MKKILAIIAIALLCYTKSYPQAGVLGAFRANVFVSATGSDSNSGKYPWAPIKTISKLNTITILPGQIVAFKSGDTFNDTTLVVKSSGTAGKPITYTAYGPGAKPVISGSTAITGWVQTPDETDNSAIYQATFATTINQLFDDGVRMRNARFSNIEEVPQGRTPVDAGYSWISKVDGNMTAITLSGNGTYAANYFAGSKVIIRVADAWDTQTADVTSSVDTVLTISYPNSGNPIWSSATGYVTGNRVVYTSTGDNAGLWEAKINNTNVTPAAGATWQYISTVERIVPNKGMVIMGKRAYIDRPGEWAQEGTTVYYWAADSNAPTNISGSTIETGINLDGKNNVTVKNLHIRNQKTYGIYQSGASVSGIRIENNTIENQEHYGIYIFPTTQALDVRIAYNQVRNTNASGIYGYYVAGATVTENTITNTGLFENWGSGGITRVGAGSAMVILPGSVSQTGRKNTITWNRISKAGYNGIYTTGWFSAQYNRTDSTTLSINDGGGIYTTSNSTSGVSDISRNITTNSKGTLAGLNVPFLLGKGIYIDEAAKNVVANYNTSVGNAYGITLHQSYGHHVRYNVTFNNRTEMRSSGSYTNFTYGSEESYSKVFQNIFVRGPETQALYETATSYRLSPLYIRQDSNRYINPYSGKLVFANDTVVPNSTPLRASGLNYYTFTNWKAQRQTMDRPNSTLNDVLFNDAVNDQRIVWNETKKPQTWYVNNAKNVRYIDSSSVASTFILQPFESKYIKGRHLYLVKPEVSSQDTSGTLRTIGTTEVLGNPSTAASVRRAIPVTFPNVGDSVTIQSISVYHNAGTGNVILGVYGDNGGSPSVPGSLLRATASTTVNGTAGWQTINLTAPVTIAKGQKVWLAWVFQNVSNIRFASATANSSISSDATFASGLPGTFGYTSIYLNSSNFSVYCTYTIK